jgi:UDP-N-acetylglucosamine--N-acetylmuramyl-(pentapeptide) pyrophosphoryl-undecaprenol N-acetylglucosamine transferase
MKNKRILLTGGHAATTAIAVAEELIRRSKPYDLYWLGSNRTVEGGKAFAPELTIFNRLSVKTSTIVTGRLQRKFTFWTIPSLLKIPLGVIQSFLAVGKIKPDVVLSFGGYASFPVVLAAWVFGIPVVIHEQTVSLGLANKLSSYFAKKVLLSREIGNPVMTQVCEVEPKLEVGDPPTILVMGGSRGSKIINEVIFGCLKDLLKKYRVIHLTGEADFSKFVNFKDSKYEVYSWVDPLKIDGLYRQADVVIARAGANTVSELMITKRPCLLIPIPWSYANEQANNALKAKDFGLARVISQNKLTPELLLSEINNLVHDWGKIVERVKGKKTKDALASQKVVAILEGYLK